MLEENLPVEAHYYLADEEEHHKTEILLQMSNIFLFLLNILSPYVTARVNYRDLRRDVSKFADFFQDFRCSFFDQTYLHLESIGDRHI